MLKLLTWEHDANNNKSLKLYTIIILLNYFEQYLFLSNTVISDNFGKNIFVTLPRAVATGRAGGAMTPPLFCVAKRKN